MQLMINLSCVCVREREREREGEREREDLLPGLEDGLDIGVEVLSGEAPHLETIVNCVCLLQLHDLLRELGGERGGEGERGKREREGEGGRERERERDTHSPSSNPPTRPNHSQKR